MHRRVEEIMCEGAGAGVLFDEHWHAESGGEFVDEVDFAPALHVGHHGGAAYVTQIGAGHCHADGHDDGSLSSSCSTRWWMVTMESLMVLSHTVGRFSKLRVLPHRSNTPICTSERANLMPMMRKCVVLSLSPMERRFLELPDRRSLQSCRPR